MGASVSTQSTSIDILNETNLGLSQTTMNNIKNICENNTTQSNVLNIIGSNVTKLNTNQKNAAKNMCILQTAIQNTQDAAENASLMSSLANQINQKSSAGLGISVSNSNTNISSKNILNMQLDQTTINNAITGCINKLDQQNVINVIGSNVTDSNLDQGNDSFVQCLSSYGVTNQNQAKADAATSSQTNNTTSQESAGFDPTKIFQAYFNFILGAVALSSVLSLGSSVVSSMGGKDSAASSAISAASNVASMYKSK